MDPVNQEKSTLKRRRLKGGDDDTIPVDRISSLPESIISHILSLLPTKSAVATSFLSKGWRLRWTKVTAFDFDDRLWPNSVRSEPETLGAVIPAMNFVEFVNLVFAYHTDSLHKLRLHWQTSHLRSVSLNTWLNVAIARNFRVLDLATVPVQSDWWPPHIDVNYQFSLPVGLYTCATLETVKLRGPFRIQLPHAVCLPKLTVLELSCVSFENDECFEKLISSCPVLHSFEIKRYSNHRDLLVCKVSSPSLKRLHFFHQRCNYGDLKLVIDTPELKHLVVDSVLFSEITCVQQVMPVKELEINAVCESDLPRGDGVAGLIKACDGVKVLNIWESAMQALGRGAALLPATFGRLTKLVVEFNRSQWSILLDLIYRCIHLKKLEIGVFDMDNPDDADRILESNDGSYWRHPVRVPVCLSSSLKYVYFGLFTGLEDEMAMLKFLLDHGLQIKRVRICTRYARPISDSQKLKIINEVLMLSRASTTCKMSFT